MIRVNLLPHREQKRQRRRTQLIALGVVTVIAALVVTGLVHTYFANLISAQEAKNKFLQKEIDALKVEIAEIDKLKEQIEALKARKGVIESLQNDRNEAVRLLEQLTQRTPTGVQLKSVKQTGTKVALIGYTQGGSRVSQFMRNLESSDLLSLPKLGEVKKATDKAKTKEGDVSEFNLEFMIKRAQPEESKDKSGGKGSSKDKKA